MADLNEKLAVVLNNLEFEKADNGYVMMKDVRQALGKLPCVQPRTGKWARTYRDGFGNLIGHCNKCGRRYPVDNFCANCGAYMRGDSDD